MVVHSECFSTFVDPGCRIPSFITSYTGISDAHVRGAPNAVQALAAFSRFVGTNTLLAHNGHRFDMPFIRAACAKTGLPTQPIDYADSIYLSKRVWSDARRHGLDMVIERLGWTPAATGGTTRAVTLPCSRKRSPGCGGT